MEPTFLFVYASPLFEGISTWLLNSLWMGLALALLVWVVMTATSRSSAKMRYNLLLGCFVLFCAAMLIMPFWQLSHLSSIEPLVVNKALNNASGPLPVLTGGGNYTDDITGRIMDFTRQHSFVIVSLWLLVIMIRIIRLATGLYSISRTRLRNTVEVPAEWLVLLNRLKAALGVTSDVRLLASCSVTVPVVMGHLRPVILLPIQLVTSLPAAQLEPILLHELAHIMRKDYLVNLLVTAFETLFFFNPAVIWVASLIRRERENCCDDITIATTGRPAEYIEALLSCQQLQQESPALLPALLGKPRHLLLRVKRMLHHHNRTLNNMEKSILSISLVTGALLGLAFTGKPSTHKEQVIVPMPVLIGRPVPETACGSVDRLSANHYYLFTGQTDTVPVPPPPPKPPTPPPPSKDKPGTPAPPPPPPPAKTLNRSGASAPVPPTPATPPSETAPTSSSHPPGPGVPAPPAADENRDLIIHDLQSDGIIKGNPSSLSFKLSTTEFIVNGKRQPKETFEKYRKKYVRHTGNGEWSWSYNFNTSEELQ